MEQLPVSVRFLPNPRATGLLEPRTVRAPLRPLNGMDMLDDDRVNDLGALLAAYILAEWISVARH